MNYSKKNEHTKSISDNTADKSQKQIIAKCFTPKHKMPHNIEQSEQGVKNLRFDSSIEKY